MKHQAVLGDVLRHFHEHRDLLRSSCDSLHQPLTRANDFLNSNREDGGSEKREFFASGIKEAEEKIKNLFPPGVLASEPGSTASNPCLVVIGQTKAGKSSFINALLGGNYVCQTDLACTARLTRLTYGERLRVRCRYPGGQIGAWQEAEGEQIPSRLVQLSPDDRRDPDQINVVVEAEVPSELLQPGLDIYDSPGRNENRLLRSLTDGAFNSLVPMLVYVIDGRSLLTTEDVADLDSIKRQHPASTVFYVVTKLDLPHAGEAEQARRSMAVVRRGLVDRGLLPDTPGLLHGVSLLRVQEEAASPLADAFDALRAELFRFVAEELDSRVLSAADGLQRLATLVLDGCVQKANSNVQDNFRSLRRLRVRQQVEEAVFSHLLHVLRAERDNIAAKIDAFFASCRASVLAKVPGYSYAAELEVPAGQSLPADSALVERCLEDLRDFLLLCVTTELRGFLEERVLRDQLDVVRRSLQSWDPDVGDTFRRLGDVEEEEEALSAADIRSFVTDASATILRAYRAALDDAVRSAGLLDKMRGFLRSLWNNFLGLFRGRASAVEMVNPRAPQWKRQQARLLLDSALRHATVSADICQVVLDHIASIHARQQAQFADDEALYRAYKKTAKEDRERIAELTKPFAVAHLVSTSVLSHHRVRRPALLTPLGVGSQGTVYKATVSDERGQERLVALKQVLVADKFLAQQALEIFYTVDFDHPHLLPLLGVHYEHQREHDTNRIRIFMPLMATNCRAFLNKNGVSPLGTRLRIGQQVCAALVYLHRHGIIHRDIKLENVLLDDNLKAYVADFGLSKPVGLTNWSVVGSPIHMAPEIVENALVSHNNRETMTYNEAVDVYAFGVLMWYLVDGTGKHPEFVKELRDVYDVLNASRFGKRPERPREASNALWALIEDCWKGKPEERPSMIEVEERLRASM